MFARYQAEIQQFQSAARQSLLTSGQPGLHVTRQIADGMIRYVYNQGQETLHVAIRPETVIRVPIVAPLPVAAAGPAPAPVDAWLAIDIQFAPPTYIYQIFDVGPGIQNDTWTTVGQRYGFGGVADFGGGNVQSALTCFPLTGTGNFSGIFSGSQEIIRDYGLIDTEAPLETIVYDWDTQLDPGTGSEFGAPLYAGGGFYTYAAIGTPGAITITVYGFSGNWAQTYMDALPVIDPAWVDQLNWRIQAREIKGDIEMVGVRVANSDALIVSHDRDDFSVILDESHAVPPFTPPDFQWGFATEPGWVDDESYWPADAAREHMGTLLAREVGTTENLTGPETPPDPSAAMTNPSWFGDITGMTPIATISWTPPVDALSTGTATITPI